MIIQRDCLKWMRKQPDDCVDMVMCSPPYEDRRTYSIDFKLAGQDWVDWMVPIVQECLRVCKGLCCFVVCGKTVNGRYSCTPELLVADLHRSGVILRRPPLYVRWGVPGSGGKDWLANRYEPIICCSKTNKLPWSDNTACGHPPKYETGGAMSNRHTDGKRKNDRGSGYTKPKLANPGNLIDCGAVGGGHIGSKMAHDNEAPYPLKVPLTLIKSFCKPGGLVFDPFSGSGTTAEAAITTGRNFIGTDIRASQVKLTEKRIKLAKTRIGFGIK